MLELLWLLSLQRCVQVLFYFFIAAENVLYIIIIFIIILPADWFSFFHGFAHQKNDFYKEPFFMRFIRFAFLAKAHSLCFYGLYFCLYFSLNLVLLSFANNNWRP